MRPETIHFAALEPAVRQLIRMALLNNELDKLAHVYPTTPAVFLLWQVAHFAASAKQESQRDDQ